MTAVRRGAISTVQLQIVRDPNGILCDRYLPATGPDAAANARLMAAAPDLLLALQRILDNPDYDLLPSERAGAEAAIRKATGER